MNHDWDCAIGRPAGSAGDAGRLFVRGSVVETAHGQDVRVPLRERVVKFLSIGCRSMQREECAVRKL